jgi:hypothetical protein
MSSDGESSAGKTAGIVIGILVAVAAGIFVLVALRKSVIIVREKQAVVLERLGKFKSLLTPGLHIVLWPLDKPKQYSVRYYINDAMGNVVLVERLNQTKISTQDEIVDLPKQQVITRDNAAISVDVLLNYKVINPKSECRWRAAILYAHMVAGVPVASRCLALRLLSACPGMCCGDRGCDAGVVLPCAATARVHNTFRILQQHCKCRSSPTQRTCAGCPPPNLTVRPRLIVARPPPAPTHAPSVPQPWCTRRRTCRA